MAGRPQGLNRSGLSRWPCFSVFIDDGCSLGNNCVSSCMRRFFPVSERNVYDAFAVREVCILNRHGSSFSCQLVFLQEERGARWRSALLASEISVYRCVLCCSKGICVYRRTTCDFCISGFMPLAAFLHWCNKC